MQKLTGAARERDDLKEDVKQLEAKVSELQQAAEVQERKSAAVPHWRWEIASHPLVQSVSTYKQQLASLQQRLEAGNGNDRPSGAVPALIYMCISVQSKPQC